MIRRFVFAGVGAVLLAGAIGCGSNPTSPSGNASLSVLLKDTPFSDAKAVLVTFSDVSAHASGGNWTTVPFAGGATSRTCDLKQLTSAQDVLGTGGLAAGHYTEIRLTVSSAALYFDNAAPSPACTSTIATPPGRNATLEISNGQVFLNRQFDLTAGSTTTMLLDFNGDQSIMQTGNGTYKMSPVITVVSVQ